MNAKNAVIAALSIAVVAGCGARTGLNVPDLPNLAPPSCSATATTIPISVIPDPLAPAPEHITSVDWNITRRCASDASRGRNTQSCHVLQRGDTEVSGDCSLGTSPAVFQVTTPTNTPGNIGFRLSGPLQGDVCVTATMTTLEGTTLQFQPRAWRVMPPATVPSIVLQSRRNAGDSASSIVNGTSALPPATTTVRGTTMQICPEN